MTRLQLAYTRTRGARAEALYTELTSCVQSIDSPRTFDLKKEGWRYNRSPTVNHHHWCAFSSGESIANTSGYYVTERANLLTLAPNFVPPLPERSGFHKGIFDDLITSMSLGKAPNHNRAGGGLGPQPRKGDTTMTRVEPSLSGTRHRRVHHHGGTSLSPPSAPTTIRAPGGTRPPCAGTSRVPPEAGRCPPAAFRVTERRLAIPSNRPWSRYSPRTDGTDMMARTARFLQINFTPCSTPRDMSGSRGPRAGVCGDGLHQTGRDWPRGWARPGRLGIDPDVPMVWEERPLPRRTSGWPCSGTTILSHG